MKKQTKNSYKKFGKIVSEFSSNWKKIKEAAKKKQKLYDQYK